MLNLTKTERNFLYYKYTHLGFESFEANKQIRCFTEYLKNLGIRLKKRKMEEKDINARFKKEFEILCQKLEAERDEV